MRVMCVAEFTKTRKMIFFTPLSAAFLHNDRQKTPFFARFFPLYIEGYSS
jgi:hypothetical protein